MTELCIGCGRRGDIIGFALAVNAANDRCGADQPIGRRSGRARSVRRNASPLAADVQRCDEAGE
jgi:hypothetical protein